MQYSIVEYKKLWDLSQDFRFDADFFHPKYLKEDRQRDNFKNILIRNFCYVTDGQHGYHEVDESSPIYHLTAKNAKGWFANTEGADRLAKWVDDKNKRSSLKEKDLILSTRGTVGLCALVTQEALPANIDQDVARIIVEANSEIEPEFLLAYLNCSFGQDWLVRNSSGMVQQGLSLDKVRDIPVPILSVKFLRYCKDIILKAYGALRRSEKLYFQAEQILFSELGLLNWKPQYRLSFVKNFSDTQAGGRMDAEYFQPKYDEILEKLTKYKYGSKPIEQIFKQNRTFFKITHNDEYRYVEISSVNTATGEIDPLILLGSDLPPNAKIKLNINDVIISKVRTYRGAISIIQEDNLVGSSAFTVLRETGEINRETLFAYLKSKPILELSLKYNAGTSYPVIDDSDMLNLPFPIIPKDIQDKIRLKITGMYNTKALSKRLLEIAKRGVETVIEENEKDALAWIDMELKKLNVSLDQ